MRPRTPRASRARPPPDTHAPRAAGVPHGDRGGQPVRSAHLAASCGSLAAPGGRPVSGGRQADSSERPLRRRAARIARPARVRIRSRNPWVLARRRLLGWKVRLLTRGSRGRARFSAGDRTGTAAVDTLHHARTPATTGRPRNRAGTRQRPPPGHSRYGCPHPRVKPVSRPLDRRRRPVARLWAGPPRRRRTGYGRPCCRRRYSDTPSAPSSRHSECTKLGLQAVGVGRTRGRLLAGRVRGAWAHLVHRMWTTVWTDRSSRRTRAARRRRRSTDGGTR